MLRRLCLLGLTAAALFAVSGFCLHNGYIQCNHPDRDRFPLRGVDVSHHQGLIDWAGLARQDVAFAFIKAAEGGDFKDTRFQDNWREARKAGLAVGAYHFFLPLKSGREQARNFIGSVPVQANALPPALDVECSVVPPGPKREAIRDRIRECLALLEAHYGKVPAIYTTYEAHEAYLRRDFDRHPLWIRSVFTFPDPKPLGCDWLFWQYSSRGRLAGYSGREPFIDLNVFNGTREDFARLLAGDS